MGKRIKSEKKGGGGEESKFIEEYTPLCLLSLHAICLLLINVSRILGGCIC